MYRGRPGWLCTPSWEPCGQAFCCLSPWPPEVCSLVKSPAKLQPSSELWPWSTSPKAADSQCWPSPASEAVSEEGEELPASTNPASFRWRSLGLWIYKSLLSILLMSCCAGSLQKKSSESFRLCKLMLCLFNFPIIPLYYLCFTYRETALHCAIELVVQWLKGIKQWLWYFKYCLGGIFNSFLIMKQATQEKTPQLHNPETLIFFSILGRPLWHSRTKNILKAFSLFSRRIKIKRALTHNFNATE